MGPLIGKLGKPAYCLLLHLLCMVGWRVLLERFDGARTREGNLRSDSKPHAITRFKIFGMHSFRLSGEREVLGGKRAQYHVYVKCSDVGGTLEGKQGSGQSAIKKVAAWFVNPKIRSRGRGPEARYGRRLPQR